jgi:hypothetical protein
MLSRDIYCEDGVATAVIAQAADELERQRLLIKDYAFIVHSLIKENRKLKGGQE